MESVAAGWCTVKYLRHDQTIRNVICGDLEIPLVVIWLGVTRLKKTGLVCLLDFFFWEEGGGGIMGFSVCEAPLDDWASGGSVDVSFTYGESGFSSMEI